MKESSKRNPMAGYLLLLLSNTYAGTYTKFNLINYINKSCNLRFNKNIVYNYENI